MGAEGSGPEGTAREAILRFIRENPGCYLRKIRGELNLGMGTVQYHLNRLEKDGRIVSERHSFRRHYFVAGTFREREKLLLEVLGNETAREILLFVLERKNPSQTDLSRHVGISSPSISWHVKRLQASGIVEESREGPFKRYRLRGDPGAVVALLRTYYPGIWDRWSNRLAEMFLALSARREGP